MTPKEKAESLVSIMHDVDFWDDADFPIMEYEHAKQCALRAVDEILEECSYWSDGNHPDWENERHDYWLQVKLQIHLL